MSTPLITIIITTWNSKKYLPFCLSSIFDQTFKDFSIIVIDNGSTDDTVEYIKENFKNITVLKNPKNLGFAHANNQGIQMSKTDYVLLCNSDIILEKNFLEKVVKTMQSDSQIASVSGKLLKARWDKEELPKPQKTDTLDSCGIQIFKSHQVRERGQDQKDTGQYIKQQEVFGNTGALILLKKSALEDINYNNEYFDKNFFSYKEDIDLSWRLGLAGYKSVYNPEAIAYHFRRISQKDDRKTRSKLFSQLSYKNHLLTIVKNQTCQNFLIYFPFIFWYELKKLIYILLFEQTTLVGLFQFFKQLPHALQKRKVIMTKKKVTSKQIRRWFN